MKIVFTSSYETFSKENTKNYIPNSYVLVFLISVIFFFLIIWDGGREYVFIVICGTYIIFLFIILINQLKTTKFICK